MYRNDSIEEHQISFAAEQQGYKYIELQLDARECFKGQDHIRFSGIKVAKSYEDGVDRDSGMAKYVVKVIGGFVDFVFNERRRAWFGYLLDDKEGWNRKFLASHIYSDKTENKGIKWDKYRAGESQFIIIDPDIKHDIMLIRRELDGEKVERVKPISDIDALKAKVTELEKSNEDKDAQMKKLQNSVPEVRPLTGKVTKDMKARAQNILAQETLNPPEKIDA